MSNTAAARPGAHRYNHEAGVHPYTDRAGAFRVVYHLGDETNEFDKDVEPGWYSWDVEKSPASANGPYPHSIGARAAADPQWEGC